MNNFYFKIDQLLGKIGQGYLNSASDYRIDFYGRIVLSLIVSGLCLCVYLASVLIFGLFSHTYRNLPIKERMFWNLAMVRSVYGLIGAVLSGYERWFDADLSDPIDSQTLHSTLLLAGHLGFFIFEVTAQTGFDIRFRTFSKALHAHHMLALVGYFLIIKNNIAHYFGVSVFVLEASTPFSCICYCLIKAKLEKTLLWKANQFLLVKVFHMRSLLEFVLMYEIYKHWSKVKEMPVLLIANLVGGTLLVGFVLTPYWKFKKTQQMFNPADWSSVTQLKKQENMHKEVDKEGVKIKRFYTQKQK